MAFRTTPQLGPQLDDVYTSLPYWDGGLGVSNGGTGVAPSPKLGTRETGSDGHDYIWVKASAEIASASGNGTQVVIDEPAFTAAAGSGGWYSIPSVTVADQTYFWARKGALDAM